MGEGRKEGEWSCLAASDIYTNHPESVEVRVWLITNGPVPGISSKCGFSPILSSAIDICGSVRSGAEPIFTGPQRRRKGRH